jgi:hypothetical protein
MTPCVCGHLPVLHSVIAEHRPCFVCTCRIFEPDDGTPSVLGHPRIETYTGFYAGKKWA